MSDALRVAGAVVTALALVLAADPARADEPPAPPPVDPTSPAGATPVLPATPVIPVIPALSTPPPTLPANAPMTSAPDDKRPFKIDPITDATIVGLGLGFGAINELILTTGEIRPQRPVDPNALLGIDSGAVTQTFDTGASERSNIGLYAALGFALLDPILSGFRDGPDAGIVDAVLYSESLSLTFALTDLAKIAVRRPRPSAYVAQAQLDKMYGPDGPSITDTDQSLSFFSGHAAICAATSATATYLAFTRAPGTWRPWVTLAAGTLLTAGVSYERVRAGAHFPTDVIAGTLAGAGMGIIVPHLHRRGADGSATWIGLDPVPAGLGLALQGIF